MSILIDQKTKLIVQGITGREGTFHTELMQKYGTKIVAGVTPGKGGNEIYGIPVFDTVQEATEKTDANTSILFVPPRFTKDGILEAIDNGIKLVVAITEGVPFHDMLLGYTYARLNNCTLIGPNTAGIISPGKSKVGFMPDNIYKKGNVGIMSRSATLSYEVVNNLTNNGIGQSTFVGVGGDPVQGSAFIDLLPLFEKDPDTDLIIIIGEIGGSDEETAAEYIGEKITKPVVAFIAGETAPKAKRMGHAGAIISADGKGNAKCKKEKFKSAGVYVVEELNEIVEMVLRIL